MKGMIDTHRECIVNFMQIPHEQITKSSNKGEGSANNNNNIQYPHTISPSQIHAIKIEQKILRIDALKHIILCIYLFLTVCCFFVADFYIIPMVFVPIA